MTNFYTQKQRDLLMTIYAQVLLLEWFEEEDISSDLENPRMEEVIVEAAAEIVDSDTQDEWIALVQGNGKDSRRIKLAERCKERIVKRIESLRSCKPL